MPVAMLATGALQAILHGGGRGGDRSAETASHVTCEGVHVLFKCRSLLVHLAGQGRIDKVVREVVTFVSGDRIAQPFAGFP